MHQLLDKVADVENPTDDELRNIAQTLQERTSSPLTRVAVTKRNSKQIKSGTSAESPLADFM